MQIIADDGQWNTLILGLPGAHLLQTSQWASIKAGVGWRPFYLVWPGQGGSITAAVLVLERTLRFGGFSAPIRVQYAPRGPLLDWADEPLRMEVLTDLAGFARRRRAILIKIDPELHLGWGVPGRPDATEDPVGLRTAGQLREQGWVFSPDQVQFRNTVLIDLRSSEADLLAKMKQKTRYNIRLAEKKGVGVRVGSPADFSALYQMYAETAVRDGFVIRGQDYYLEVWRTFHQSGMLEPLIAEVDGQMAAAVMVFRFARKAWYLYGMSRDLHREKMPNALLQWEAIRRSRQAGCRVYDLWGAPDVFDESDSMWGVYRFKEGLGGQVLRTAGAWDFAPNRFFYLLYTKTLPRILDVMRRRGKARTQEELHSI